MRGIKDPNETPEQKLQRIRNYKKKAMRNYRRKLRLKKDQQTRLWLQQQGIPIELLEVVSGIINGISIRAYKDGCITMAKLPAENMLNSEQWKQHSDIFIEAAKQAQQELNNPERKKYWQQLRLQSNDPKSKLYLFIIAQIMKQHTNP